MYRYHRWHCELGLSIAIVIGRVSHGYAESFVSYPLWAVDCCHCFYCEIELLKYPGFGLQLSCFGHVRAKNNSVLPCGLKLCLIFCWDYPWLFFFLHRAVKGLIVAGMQWLVFGLCWLGRLLKAC